MAEKTDTPEGIAFRTLELLRGQLGAEDGIDVVLRTLYARRCHGHEWPAFCERVERRGDPLSEPQLDRILEHLGFQSAMDLRPLCEFIQEIPNDLLTPTFEAILSLRARNVGRQGQESRDPDWLNDLAATLACNAGGSFFDPTCGFGGTLLTAHRRGATRLIGTDINKQALETCRMRMAMHDVQAELTQTDSTLEAAPTHADSIAFAPPMGLRLLDHQRERWKVSARDDVGMWLRMSMEALKPDGRAVVLVPYSRLRTSQVFTELAAQGNIEAVLVLPPNALERTAVVGCLIALCRDASPETALLAMNLTGDFELGGAGSQLAPRAESLDNVVDVLANWRAHHAIDLPAHRAVLVPRERILTEGFEPRFAEPPETPIVWPEPAAHLIKTLRVNGVKSLATRQSIPMAPITLLYGPNSVGKSTVIQSLLMLLQSAESSSLVTKGRFVDLGTYINAVTSHDPDRGVSLGLEFGIVPPWRNKERILHPSLIRSLDFSFTSNGSLDANVTHAEVGFAGHTALSLIKSEDQWRIDEESLEPWLELLSDDSSAFFDPTSQRKRDKGPGRAKQLARMLLRTESVIGGGGLFPTTMTITESSLAGTRATTQMSQLATGLVNNVLNQLSRETGRLTQRVVHLGPIRPAPQRVVERQQDASSSTIDYASYLYETSSAVAEVNEWLATLSIPYALAISSLSTQGPVNAVSDLLAIVLTDTRTGVQVSPTDVGYGVSQVLPIVVQLLRPNETVICIEQPELHLHPRLQASLADIFIRSTSPDGGFNQVIAETHSEHLLLRLQRRIREGVISPDDVSVLYVDQPEGAEGAQVRRLRLGPQGEFLDPWPTGFFDDSLEDVLEGWS